jgi:hypothetical protein
VAGHAAAHRAKANESNTHQYLRIRPRGSSMKQGKTPQ